MGPLMPYEWPVYYIKSKYGKDDLEKSFCHLYLFSVGLPDKLVCFLLVFEKI